MTSWSARTRPGTLVGVIFLGLCLILSASAEELRTFTGTSGETVKARILMVEGTSVRLRLVDGREIEGAIRFFSPEDQLYIREWSKTAGKHIDYDFSVSEKDHLLKKDKIKEDNHTWVTYETRDFSVEITNRARVAVKDLEVRYQIFKKTDKVVAKNRSTMDRDLKRHGDYRVRTGSKTIPVVESRRSATIQTEPITMMESDLVGGWYYPDGSDEKREEELIGIIVRIYHRGKLVHEAKSESSTMNRYDPTWHGSS